MALSELQRRLSRLIQSRSSLPNNAECAREVASYLTGNARLSPVEQLEIYREQFWFRHTSALVDDFPGLTGILGQRDWERLVEGYLRSHAPTHYSLRDLGAQLPDYVEQQTWLEHATLCADMARLEWAYIESFDAPDAAKLDPAALAAFTPEQWATARLELDPALHLLKVAYPVADLRVRLKSSSKGGEAVPIPDPREQNLVIYRQDRDLRFAEVPGGAFELLGRFQAGMSLVESVESVVESGAMLAHEVGQELTEWFQAWARLGWITRVVTG